MLQYTIQSLMRQLQSKSMPGYQQIQNMMNLKQNPEPYIKQALGNMSSEQKQAFFRQAQGYGVPKEILSKLQNMR